LVEGDDDIFGPDFILTLNGGKAPLEICEDVIGNEEMKEENDIDPFGLLKGFMPSGMSGES